LAAAGLGAPHLFGTAEHFLCSVPVWDAGLYAVRFSTKLWKLAQGVTEMAEDDFLIAVLHLVDAALIASLVFWPRRGIP